jgi:hypothetical protein
LNGSNGANEEVKSASCQRDRLSIKAVGTYHRAIEFSCQWHFRSRWPFWCGRGRARALCGSRILGKAELPQSRQNPALPASYRRFRFSKRTNRPERTLTMEPSAYYTK